jgi:hypothetical protein
MDRNEIPHDPSHLGVPSGASKMVSKPMVCLAQTMHLFCTDTNTIYKWTDTRFHITNVTKEFHWVQPNWFMCLWYVQRKTMHLSCVKVGTISKQTESSFHLSLVTMEYQWTCPKWFLSLRDVWRKPCTYLEPTLTLSPNGSKQDSTWPTSPTSSIRRSNLLSKSVIHLVQIMHLSCVKLSSISKRTDPRY